MYVCACVCLVRLGLLQPVMTARFVKRVPTTPFRLEFVVQGLEVGAAGQVEPRFVGRRVDHFERETDAGCRVPRIAARSLNVNNSTRVESHSTSIGAPLSPNEIWFSLAANNKTGHLTIITAPSSVHMTKKSPVEENIVADGDALAEKDFTAETAISCFSQAALQRRPFPF